MKRFNGWGERFFQWVDRHAGVAVLFLAFGAVFTSLAVQDAAWAQFFGVLTALGTLAAAFAALGATAATRSQLQQQLEREQEERRPSIRVADFKTVFSPSRDLCVTFVNPSQYAVHINACVIDPDTGPGHYRASFLNVFVPPNGSVEADVGGFLGINGDILRFYFQYGRTGRKFHCLSLPFSTRNASLVEEGDLQISVEMSRQWIDENVEFTPFTVASEWSELRTEGCEDQGSTLPGS